MSKYLIFFIVPVFLFSCDIKRKDRIADDSAKTKAEIDAKYDTTSVQLIDSAYNFGTITEGEKVEYSFRFKNSGNKALIISEAHASCGCTVPEKPEKPILPGETGFLKVVFNSAGKHGHTEKEIFVTANTKPAFPDLKLTGEIKDKE